MSDAKIGCQTVPCASCPYRKDVPSGIWAAEEYQKLPAYDRQTREQPPSLFMCHQQNNSLCTGWLQSHANREHAYDLLSLRLARNLDTAEVSRVALMEPLVKLFKTGREAMRHGLKALRNPGKKAKQVMAAITRKRGSVE